MALLCCRQSIAGALELPLLALERVLQVEHLVLTLATMDNRVAVSQTPQTCMRARVATYLQLIKPRHRVTDCLRSDSTRPRQYGTTPRKHCGGAWTHHCILGRYQGVVVACNVIQSHCVFSDLRVELCECGFDLRLLLGHVRQRSVLPRL